MGVTYFYFSAPHAEIALERMKKENWFASFDSGENENLVVPLKGIDHTVILGKLISFIRHDLGSNVSLNNKSLWPPVETKPINPEDFANLSPDSPWLNGPYLEMLDVEIRDSLQSVALKAVPGLAAEWANIEEWEEREPTAERNLIPIIIDLISLARKAHEKNEMMFALTIL